MKRAPFVGLAWTVVLGALGAARLQADNATISMSGPTTFKQTDGAALFQAICQGCHMPNAQGAVGAGSYPSLVADEKLDSADFVMSVLLGGLKGMPSVGDMMSDAQVADVVNYVRTHFGNTYPGAVSAADVAAARRQATAR